MRIIAGKYGRRRFQVPAKFKGRPTTDMAKEGLFNILYHRIDLDSISVLDLFAGSGSIGFEFLSRGAGRVDAVEKDSRHVSFIKSVQEELNDPNYNIYTSDVFHFLKMKSELGDEYRYDLIFADPPYTLSNLRELPRCIMKSKMLAPGGTMIIEHPRAVSFVDDDLFDEVRNYGSVHFSFFINKIYNF